MDHCRVTLELKLEREVNHLHEHVEQVVKGNVKLEICSLNRKTVVSSLSRLR